MCELREEERAKEEMRRAVLASHLALVNATLALESNEKPMPLSNQKPTPDHKIRESNRDLEKFREFVGKMRASPQEYIRAVGYHELFGLEPSAPEKRKTADEIIAEGFAAARRTLASFGEDATE